MKLEAHRKPSRKMGLRRKSKIASRSTTEGGTKAQARVHYRVESRRVVTRRKPGEDQTGLAGRWTLRRKPEGYQPVEPMGTTFGAIRTLTFGHELNGFRFDARRRFRPLATEPKDTSSEESWS